MSRVWFVTGANGGMGAAIVEAALRAGNHVIATGRDPERLFSAFPDIDVPGLTLMQLDVTDPVRTTEVVTEIVERFGRIDVLVCNAGSCILGDFEDLVSDDFQRQLDTNLSGAVHLMQAVLPAMRWQRSGHIVVIGSAAGAIGMHRSSAYSASKFALEGLSMAVAAEVKQFGINVTIVEPGSFRTRFIENTEIVDTRFEDYAPAGSSREARAPRGGNEPGDPSRLGEALLRITAMDDPPELFVAGRDAIAILRSQADRRMQAISAHLELSISTDHE